MCVFFETFYFISKLQNKFNRKIIEAQCNENDFYIKRNIKKNIKVLEKFFIDDENEGIYKKIQQRLMQNGNPFNLNVISYIFIKTFISITFFLIGSFGYKNVFIALIFGALGFFIIDFQYYFKNKKENKIILKDLPDIVDILEIQTFANVDLGIALGEVYDVPKSKRLQEAFQRLSAEISLTKNYEKALDKFLENFNLQELTSFIFAIKQAITTGKSKKMLCNQSDVLNEKNIFDIQGKTKKIDSTVMSLGFLILSGTVLMILYAFATLFKTNLHNIFGY